MILMILTLNLIEPTFCYKMESFGVEETFHSFSLEAVAF